MNNKLGIASVNQSDEDIPHPSTYLRPISGIKILLGISAIIWLWTLCWLLPFWFVILYVTPFLLFSSLLVNWLVESRLGRHRYLLPGWKIQIYQGALVGLLLAAPVSSYFYGQLIARQFVQELGVEVRLVEQQVSILEQFGFGVRRGVVTIYELLEPKDVVEDKIRQRILVQGEPSIGINPVAALGWQVGKQEVDYLCESENGMYTSVRINAIGQLVVHLLHHRSPYCRLE